MTPTQQFLNAVFAANDTASPKFFTAGNEVEYSLDLDGEIYTSPLTTDGVAFVFGVQPDITLDDALAARVKPTAVLQKDNTSIIVWALDVFEKPEAVLPLASALGMESIDELLPLPSANWVLTYCDADHFASLIELNEAYLPVEEEVIAEEVEAEIVEEPGVKDLGTYGDAKILRAYNEMDYMNNVVVTLGARTDSKNWAPQEMPLGLFMAKLVQHKEGKKDGPAFVLGDSVPGQRLKNSVKAMYFIGIDIDVGTPSETVDAALTKLGCTAVRYSTHSHAKTITEFKKDKVAKYAAGEDIDDDLIRRFLLEDQKWDAGLIATATYGGSDHTERGLVYFVKHAPMPKHRIVIPLVTPYVIDAEGNTQKEATDKWARVIDTMSAELGLPYDRACIDPSRLFYFPRHDKKRPFEASIWGGPLFDWRSLELENRLEDYAASLDKGKSKSVTPEGRELGRWSIKRAAGFQIVDVIENYASDRKRGSATHGITIECPFDEDHSNAGDRDDSGCFAVNAGEGVSEIFTLSCRHEVCRDKTALDMLGKMIKDGWFEKAVLEDESFNAIIVDDEGEKVSPSPEAEKIEKEDEARSDYEIAIAALSSNSTPDEIEAVLDLLIDANLALLALNKALDSIKKATGITVGILKKTMNAKRDARDKAATGKSSDPKGRIVFPYNGEFNNDEALDICIKALKKVNTKNEQPTYCCVLGSIHMLMSRTDDERQKFWFEQLKQDNLWSELCELVTFVRRTEQGDGSRGDVPDKVAKHVFYQAHKRLPAAPKIIYTPVFLNDGRLVSEPGYYYDGHNPEKLNLLLVDSGLALPLIPDEPTAQEAEAAAAWIKEELLSDFPFWDYDSNGNETTEPSMANAFAMILTPFMRWMINGRTPVFFVVKPDPGTGGTLLGQLPMRLFDGAGGDVMVYNQNEEEMQKELIAAVQDARSHLFFDDVTDFNSRILLRALTQNNISGRILGSSRNVSVKNEFNWVGSGNNTNIQSEMRRRTVFISLNGKRPDMQNRKFRHPDVSGLNYDEFVQKNRGTAIYHILTMIQYWIKCGKPEFSKKALRRKSYEDWSMKIGGVLEACGIEGFLDNPMASESDLNEAASRVFVRDFLKKFGCDSAQTPRDIFQWAVDVDFDIITGNSDDQKRTRFQKTTLPGLNNRTFAVDGHNYMFRRHSGKNGEAGFMLVKVEDTVEVTPAPAPSIEAEEGEIV